MNLSKHQIQHLFFILGFFLILSISLTVYANFDFYNFPGDAPGYFNDARIGQAINRIFLYLEGSFGALVMVSAGILAIVSAAFGNYRASLGLLIVAIGPFILRSFVATFFNDENIR